MSGGYRGLTAAQDTVHRRSGQLSEDDSEGWVETGRKGTRRLYNVKADRTLHTENRGTGSMTARARTRLVLLGVLLLGSAAFGCSAETTSPSQTTEAQSTYVTLDVEEAHQQLSTNQGAQTVDVREPSEWAATGVPVGAVLIPLGQLEQRAPGELAKDRPVYVICNSGNRSRTGAETLLKLGYSEVYNIAGGIQAWLKAGLPVEDPEP